MNEKILSQITEVIKTINFNGTLNSETLAQGIETAFNKIMPYMYFLEFKNLFVNILWVVAVVYATTKFVKTMHKMTIGR
jgi:hypothetical protein